jgi:hypothetical protein
MRLISSVIIVVLVLIPVYVNYTFALSEFDPAKAFDESEIVLVGKILSVKILSEYTIYPGGMNAEKYGVALYEVQVEKYLKNPSNAKIITVPGQFSRASNAMSYVTYPYEVDQRVLLYLQAEYPDTLIDYDLIIRSGDSRVLDGSLCEIGTIFSKGLCIKESQESEIMDPLSNLSPLKQSQSGILSQHIQCDIELELIFKSSDGSPACVKTGTKIKLVERSWAK